MQSSQLSTFTAAVLALIFCVATGCGDGRGTDPKAEASFEAGNSAFEEDRFEDAIASYTDAITIDPRFGVAFKNRGAAYHRLFVLSDSASDKQRDGYRNKAIDDLTKAIELTPDDAAAYLLRGECQILPEKQMADRKKALELDPNILGF